MRKCRLYRVRVRRLSFRLECVILHKVIEHMMDILSTILVVFYFKMFQGKLNYPICFCLCKLARVELGHSRLDKWFDPTFKQKKGLTYLQ